MELQDLVRAVKDHAVEHYNDGGWDVIVECWGDNQIANIIEAGDAKTVKQAIKCFKPMVDIWADRQADARNSAF